MASVTDFLFDPGQGETLLEPEEARVGSWVGAPSVHEIGGQTLLSYRRRRPRGEGRGYATYLARAEDQGAPVDLWKVPKEALGTSSIERCALAEGGDGYLLYLSYVDPTDHRWCIDSVTAASPEGLEKAISGRRVALRAGPLGLEAVKDPVVFQASGLYWMYVSCASRTSGAESISHDELHQSDDVYTTGSITSQTGLAVSRNGFDWEWLGIVLDVNPGRWDAYAARVSCIARIRGCTLAFYDGGPNANQNYEEKTGVAVVGHPANLAKLSISGPWLTSTEGSGSMRYMSVLRRKGSLEFYYEWARADGSHELRRSHVTERDLRVDEVMTDA